jgi:tetratricopeptide (TPR) repeat protein
MRSDRHVEALLLVALAGSQASPSIANPARIPSFGQAWHAPAEAQSLIDVGLQNLQRARYAQAIDAFRRAVDLSPDLLIAWYDLGVAYFALEKFDESRKAFEELRRRDPHHQFAAYFLARIDLIEGDADAAIQGFESISGSKPIADELYYLGSAYFRKGDTLAAIHTLERASDATPDDYRVHLLLARAYQKAGRNQDSSSQYDLSEKLRASYRTKSREILECQTSLVSEAQEIAADHCRRLLDGHDPTKLVSLGILLAERHLYEQAVVPLTKAARLDPENYEPQFNLGLTYFKMKDYRGAKPPLQAAVALRPESYDAMALLGSVLFALGEDFPAVEQLRRAHRFRPSDDKIKGLLFEELRLIAQHLFAAKDYKQAVSYFQEALALSPDAAELHGQLAEAQAALAEEETADREKQSNKEQP